MVFVFLAQIRKNRCETYENVGHLLCQTVTFSVGLPAKINKPVPASEARFHQIRVIERFCVEGSNKRTDRGNSSNDLEFSIDRTFIASTSSFSAKFKLNNAFPFFLVTVEEGPYKWISLGPRIS